MRWLDTALSHVAGAIPTRGRDNELQEVEFAVAALADAERALELALAQVRSAKRAVTQ